MYNVTTDLQMRVPFLVQEHSYNKRRSDTTVTPIMATVVRIELFSYAFSKLPALEKCWKARKPEIAKDMIAPSCFPLQVYNEVNECLSLSQLKRKKKNYIL